MVGYNLTIQVYKLDGSPQAGVVVNLYMRKLSGVWDPTGPITTSAVGRVYFSGYMNIDKYLEFYYLLDYGSWHYVSPVHIPDQAYTFSHTVGETSPPRENTALSIAVEGTFRVSGYLKSAGGVGLDGRWVNLYTDGVETEGMRTMPLGGGFYDIYPYPPPTGSHTFQTKFRGDINYYACVSQVRTGIYTPSAEIIVRGKSTGGYPIPSMLLEIYDKGVKIKSKTTGVASIGTFYADSVMVGTGTHRAQGRMVLTNALGSYEFLTETREFTLG